MALRAFKNLLRPTRSWDQAHLHAVEREARIRRQETLLRHRELPLDQCRRLLAEKQIAFEELESELIAIRQSQSWRLVRVYAWLKDVFYAQPLQVLKTLFQMHRTPGIQLEDSHGDIWDSYHGFGVHILPEPITYARWLGDHQTSIKALLNQHQMVQAWPDRPMLSLVVPIYNPRIQWLEKLLNSIADQTYDRWEAILVDDHSTHPETVPALQNHCRRDRRFRLVARPVNGGTAAAIQEGLAETAGRFVAVVDQDDWLAPDALYHLAKAIQADPHMDLFYTDEALIDSQDQVIGVAFRPSFSYARLLSHPYIVHLFAFRRDLALSIGGFDPACQISEDYDFLLRLAAVSDRFHHIPKILYHWRQHGGSTGHRKRHLVTDHSIRALKHHLALKQFHDATVEPGLSFNFFRVRYAIPPTRVSIIIPTRDRIDLLKNCLTSLKKLTHLPAGVQMDVIIADNDSREAASLDYLRQLANTGVQVIPCPGPFNFSAVNNRAVKHARGDMLLFLNNDIEVLEPGWLTALLEQAQPPDVGAVGAKLLYPMGLIEHAGVIIGINGLAHHSHQFFMEKDVDGFAGGHQNELLCIRECCSVSAACLMIRKAAFEKMNGFCEDFAVGLGDTDLCLRLRQAGFRNVWTPYARLIHYESITRGKHGDELHLHPKDTALFKSRWQELIKSGDPYYNPNLSLTSGCFEPHFS